VVSPRDIVEVTGSPGKKIGLLRSFDIGAGEVVAHEEKGMTKEVPRA
jgi:hypothetical protein